MPTLNQLIHTQWRKKRKKVTRRRALQGCPQKKGTCLKTFLVSPRKPNSALRKVARVLLYAAVKPRNRKKFKLYKINAYIPGEGHTLNRFSQVLVRGGPVKDLPGMQYTLIRRRYDFLPMETRRNARSKYGTKLTRWKLHHNYFKYKYW